MFSKVVVPINTPTCSLRVPVPLNSFQHLVWFIFKVLVGMWLYLMILTCVSLMTNVEYLFVCVWFFFFSYMYILLLKCLFKSSAQFYLLDCLFSYYWVLKVLGVFWIQALYQINDVQWFSPSLWIVFELCLL